MMTITLDPTPHELSILQREAELRSIPVERLASDLMREAILEIEYPEHEPNEETFAAMDELDSGGGFHAKDADELFRQCGIPLP